MNNNNNYIEIAFSLYRYLVPTQCLHITFILYYLDHNSFHILLILTANRIYNNSLFLSTSSMVTRTVSLILTGGYLLINPNIIFSV